MWYRMQHMALAGQITASTLDGSSVPYTGYPGLTELNSKVLGLPRNVGLEGSSSSLLLQSIMLYNLVNTLIKLHSKTG